MIFRHQPLVDKKSIDKHTRLCYNDTVINGSMPKEAIDMTKTNIVRMPYLSPAQA